ncbi:MAG: acyl-CoA dehydrogenase family protein [Alphaproteobacteria bacterium]
MELVLNDEHILLRESAEKLVAQLGGPAAHRQLRDSADGFDRARHKAIAEAGWLSLLVPERAGGFGLGVTGLALALEQAGRGLLTEPIAASAVVAYAIASGHSATGAAGTLNDVLAGEQIIVPALADSATPDGGREKLSAEPYHYGYRVTGMRASVPLAGSATAFLVDAAMSNGSVLLIVPVNTFGVEVAAAASVDGQANATVSFAEASMMDDAWLIAGVNQGASLCADAYDRLLLANAAEMLGVMAAALELGIGYMKTREQFGRAIGSFQALQHRAVNAHVEVELTRSLLYQVCAAVDGGRANRSMVAAVKARASEAVLDVTKSVIQMHGAIGFTDEYEAGLYLRRAMVLAARHGNAAHHRKRFAALTAAAADSGTDAPKRRKRRKRKKSIFAS